MLGDSSSLLATTTTTSGGGGGGGGSGNGGEGPPSTTVGAHDGSGEVGHVGSNSGEEDRGRGDEGDRGFGGNRWPRQETLALLKIRSEMDAAFRDASVKGPLWEGVSRKLAELGYNRSAKKCKEKFENVFKYHKRTKESRTGKQEGKTYRFFDQLEAFQNHPSSSSAQPPPPPQMPQASVASTKIAMPVANPPPSSVVGVLHITTTVPSTTATIVSQGIAPPPVNLTVPSFPPPNPTSNPTVPSQSNIQSSFPNFSPDLFSNSTSSSTSSDVELQGRHKRKRKWKDFFDRLMTEVVQKQEEMQKKFLEAIEKREHERIVHEESWRMQEMARINREREILAQERSIAAAKDAAVMALLQKLVEQQNPGQVQNNPPSSQPPQPPVPPPPQPTRIPTSTPTITPIQMPVVPVAAAAVPQVTSAVDTRKSDNGDQNFMGASSSRWPKVEVEALIRLRTELDFKYHQSGPKGPLWQDISAGMRKLGYNRSSKRCKEKWENINKYFKKVKESNKKRPEDSKTCPYFQQLDALYKEKNKIDIGGGGGAAASSNINQLKLENSVPLMVRPEQQWPPPPPQDHRPDSVMEDLESDQDNQDDKDDDDDEDEAGGYEIVANKAASVSTDE